MIQVGTVKSVRGPGVIVDCDGRTKEVRTALSLKPGDMVVVSGDRLVKKLEVAHG